MRKTSRPTPTPRLWGSLLTLALLLAGYALAFAQVAAYARGVARQELIVPGALPVPTLLLTPSTPRGDAIAVIVHGYSGSKELMLGFGVELARMGVVTYLMDLPGHGASTVPFPQAPPNQPPQRSGLVQALAEVVGYARQRSGLAHPRIIVLGHSLGTYVAGEYALSQPADALAATILVSPILSDLPDRARPANLQILVGENDLSGLATLSTRLAGAACGVTLPANTTSYACGDPARGTGRSLLVVPGATHVTILGDRQTFEQVTRWVGLTVGLASGPIQSDTRLLWFALGVLCALLAVLPLGAVLAWLLPGAGSPLVAGAASSRGALWPRVSLFALSVALSAGLLRAWAAAADALGLPALRTPLTWLVRMRLADYFGSSALALALIVCGLVWLFRRRLSLRALAARPWLPAVALGVALFLFLYLTLGALVTFSFDHFVLNGPRALRFIPLAVASVALFAVIEELFADARGWRCALGHVAAYALVLAGLIAAIALDGSLGFLSLIAPFEVLFFLLFGAAALTLRAARRDYALATALFSGLTFAWLVAAVFPIV